MGLVQMLDCFPWEVDRIPVYIQAVSDVLYLVVSTDFYSEKALSLQIGPRSQGKEVTIMFSCQVIPIYLVWFSVSPL